MAGFDIFNIKRKLSNAGHETELIDLDALYDRKLSSHENMANIESMFGMRHSSATRQAMERANRPTRKQRKRDTRGEFYQIGRSNEELDARRSALAPGFRRTRWGTSYIERRKNRSDRTGKRV